MKKLTILINIKNKLRLKIRNSYKEKYKKENN